jgi:hypothetical protein
MGLKDKGHDPAACLRLVRRLREASPRGVYIFAGTPTYWHAGTGDMEADPAWLEVWKEVDAISCVPFSHLFTISLFSRSLKNLFEKMAMREV